MMCFAFFVYYTTAYLRAVFFCIEYAGFYMILFDFKKLSNKFLPVLRLPLYHAVRWMAVLRKPVGFLCRRSLVPGLEKRTALCSTS